MRDINIGMMTSIDIASSDYCKKYFDITNRTVPSILPKKYSIDEPVNNNFDLDKIEDICIFWGKVKEGVGFMWKNKKSNCNGYAAFNESLGLSAIWVELERKSIDSNQLIQKFLKETELLDVEFAYMHYFSNEEFNSEDYDKIMPFRVGLTSRDLEGEIPNICWAMAFGKKYIEEMGINKLITAPVYKVHSFSKSLIVLQLTENIFDFADNYKALKSAKDLVKKHLGSDFFI